MLEGYVDALSTGVASGYCCLDGISDGQIEILCRIATDVSKKSVANIDDLKVFTEEADRKVFDKYAENVMYAYGELLDAV